MRALIFVLALATPAFADRLPGIDDPAFRKPFEQLLLGNDLHALHDLHAAAEAGNTAALLAVPFAINWFLPDRRKTDLNFLFKINGVRTLDAASAADPVAAIVWQRNMKARPSEWLDWSLKLYQAKETTTASNMLAIWLNQTGALGPLPDWLLDQPVPPRLLADILQFRLQDISGAVASADAEAFIIERLRADDPAAWMAMAGYARMDHADTVPLPDLTQARIAGILAAVGVTPEEGQRRMEAVVPLLLALKLPFGDVLNEETAAAVVQQLKGTPEFLPVEKLCNTACGTTSTACMTAFMAGFGYHRALTANTHPFVSLIEPAEFYATPRGQSETLRATFFQMGQFPTASPPYLAVREIDACLADAILAELP